MSRKSKAFDFKKGDKVVFLDESYDKIQLTEGTVMMVKKAVDVKRWDGKIITMPVVYVHFTNRWGCAYSKKFSDEFGAFQQDPYPLWRLRHLQDGEMRSLEKRGSHASKLHQVYIDEANKIEVDVEQKAREWKYRELDKRKQALPHGGMYLRNVVARLGFKRPNNS